MSILEVKHVKKSFGNKLVLDDINFSVNAGECLGIVGLSGGGKSTLTMDKLFYAEMTFRQQKAMISTKICR